MSERLTRTTLPSPTLPRCSPSCLARSSSAPLLSSLIRASPVSVFLVGASECASMHRCIASTPLHYDSYIAIFIISAARRCPRSRLTSFVLFLLVFFPFSAVLSSLRAERSVSSFLANHCRLNSRPARLLGTSCRASGSLNGELTPAEIPDPSRVRSFRRDKNGRGLTRRLGEHGASTRLTCAFIVTAIGNSTARCNLRSRRHNLLTICPGQSYPLAIMRSIVAERSVQDILLNIS